jgi:hypothetical protein
MIGRLGTGIVVAGSLLWTASAPSPLAAQGTVDFGEGYNVLVGYVASPPRQMLGLGVVGVLGDRGGWGLMVDGRLTTDSPSGTVLSDRTPLQADADGDVFNVDKNTWNTVNVALVKAVGREFAFYAGGGVSRKTAYLRYFDPSRERGDLGFYWVENETESKTHPNIQAGGLFRVGDRLVVQAGGQSAPMGVTAGVHLRLR